MITENFLLSVIKWLVIATLLTPLIISSSTFFPYVFGKAIAFQILTEIALVFYLYLLYLNKRRTGVYNYLPQFNILTWSLIAFFIILILGTIFSADPYYSFWSKQERMDGLFNLFHFFFFFFIISATIRDKNSWQQILNTTLIISFIVSLHALGQKMGFFFTPYGQRVTGPLGNAAFLGTYLLFNIFFALYLLFSYRAEKTWLKVWYAGVIFVELIILILTLTRGAFFGLVAGLLIFLIGYFFFSQKKELKKYSAIALIILIAVGGLLFLSRNTAFIKNSPLLQRFTDISFQTGTGKIRIISWKIGLNAFFERPILGWGQENYYVAFNKHMNPIFFTYSGETFDRAHNKIVDLLVMNGILGLLAYLALFASCLILLWPKIKQADTIAIILISLLGAFFFQNILLFDMPTSYLMFFLFLSLIYFTTAKPPTPAKKQQPTKNNKTFLKYLIWPSIFIIVIFIWTGNLKPFFASQKCIRGQQLLTNQNKTDAIFKAGMESLKESLEANTFINPETRKALAQLMLSTNEVPQYSAQIKTDGLKYAAWQLEKGLEEMPLFLDYYLHLTDVYNTLGIHDNSYYPKANQTIKKAVELYPNVPYIYYKLVVNHLLAGDYQEAASASKEAIKLNPQLNQGYWYLGIASFYAGELDAAKENTEKALSLGYSYKNNLSSTFYLAQLYEKLKDYDKAIKFYEEILKARPDDFQPKFALANTLKGAGKFQEARQLVSQLSESHPQEAEKIKDFLESLNREEMNK